MFDKILSLVRKAATDALPSGVFASVLHEAVDQSGNTTPTPIAGRVASITVELGQSQQRSIGRRPRHELDGFLTLTVYEPAGSGDGVIMGHLSTICAALVNKLLTGTDVRVRLFSPTVANGARSGSHWTKTLRCPLRATFYYPQAV